MSTDAKDTQTLRFYQQHAARYVADVAPDDAPACLVSFANRLGHNARLLDLGCGGGWAARAFQDMGHVVTAMDIVPDMVEFTRASGVSDVRVGGFDDLDWQAEFDAIWISFALQHAPRATMSATLAKISAALKPGGWLYIGIHEGSETMRDPLGRLYCHYQEGDLRDLLNNYGVNMVSIMREASTGYDGRAINVMHLEAQKHG